MKEELKERRIERQAGRHKGRREGRKDDIKEGGKEGRKEGTHFFGGDAKRVCHMFVNLLSDVDALECPGRTQPAAVG